MVFHGTYITSLSKHSLSLVFLHVKIGLIIFVTVLTKKNQTDFDKNNNKKKTDVIFYVAIYLFISFQSQALGRFKHHLYWGFCLCFSKFILPSKLEQWKLWSGWKDLKKQNSIYRRDYCIAIYIISLPLYHVTRFLPIHSRIVRLKGEKTSINICVNMFVCVCDN